MDRPRPFYWYASLIGETHEVTIGVCSCSDVTFRCRNSGHTDPAFTLRVYSNVLPNVQQEVADRIDEALGQAPSRQRPAAEMHVANGGEEAMAQH